LLSYAFTFALLACLGMTTLCAPAWAYRPFDGTDAAVVAPGELEIELQPAGTLRQGSDKTLIAPATVVNVGLPDRWEAVFQGQGQFPLSTSDQSAGVTGVGAFLKHVLRPGSLQNESGPSIATEFGALLPGINADAGFGASVAGIVSQRWEWGAVHFNSQTTLTRDHHADQFVSTILEGPTQWKIRPVAEIFYEEEFGQSHTISGLIGATACVAALLEDAADLVLGRQSLVRTMYRILAASQEVRDRRDHLRHPIYKKPELLAQAPNEVWSWDITKLHDSSPQNRFIRSTPPRGA
jgi:hypothetical protein